MTLSHLFTSNKEVVTVQNVDSLDKVLFASILSPDQSVRERVARAGFNTFELSFGETPLLVASPFTFYKKIKKAFTPTSQAYYLLWHEQEKEEDKWGFLLQYLPPHALTSKHFHKEQTEIFYLLEGELSLETSEGNIHLSSGEAYIVNPNVTHQLFTRESPSLTVLEIQKVNYKDHYLVE